RVEQGGSSAPHPALGAGLDRSLEHFEERQAAGVLSLAATDLAAQGANASPIDADAGTLRNITHNGAGGGVDAVQAVAAFDQHAGAELAGGCTHTRHDGRRQRNLELRNGVVEAPDVVQTGVGRVLGEQAHRDQDIQELRAFVDLLGHPVLYKVLAFQLLDGRVGEAHVAPVVDKAIQLVEFLAAVVFQQMGVVLAHLGQALYMVVQMRRLELAVSDFAQVEDRQASSDILIIGGLFRDKIGGGLNNGFVDVARANAIVKLNMRTQFDLGHRDVVQVLGGPINNTVDLVEVDGFRAAVTLGDLHSPCRCHSIFQTSC